MLLALIVLIIFAGGGYYWYSQNTAMPDMDTPDINLNVTPTNNTNTSTSTQTGTSSQMREITVTNQGMKFIPDTLSANKGERIRVTFNNSGGTHDLKIEGYDVGTKVISAGQSESFEFTADEAGEFIYYCSVGSHREMGMWGTLTVTE